MKGFPRMKILVSAVLVAFSIFGAVSSKASVPYGFVDEQFAGGFNLATDFAFFPDNDVSRFLIAEKTGLVRRVENGVVQSTIVLDISSDVNSYLDRGLLSIVIDKDFFAGSRYIYLAFAVESGNGVGQPKVGRIIRATLNAQGTVADPTSILILAGSVSSNGCGGQSLDQDIICCDSTSHCMGALAQSDDGYIYATIGDGAFPQITTDGMALRSQDPGALNGKVLRMTRDGRGVPGNPGYDGSGDERQNTDKIFAYGLRNGWRASVDSTSGGLLIADVGWSSYESIKLAKVDVNMQWPCFQGPIENAAFAAYDECNPPFLGIWTDPVEAYGRTVGVAVASAIRVPFLSWPSQYRNKIFFTDYVQGWMRFFGMNAAGEKTSNSQLFAESLNGPVQVRVGPNDTLYYLSINSKEIRAITYQPDPSPPEIIGLSPPDLAISIEMTTGIEVSLSKLADESTLPGSITVTKTVSGTPVGGVIEQDLSQRIVRFLPSMELDGNTEYTVQVSGLRDPDGQLLTNPSTTTFTTGTGRTIFVSDLPFITEVNNHGPIERDMTNGKEKALDGVSPILIRGIPFDKGIGCVPLSELSVSIPAGCTRFQSTIGIDDSSENLDGGRAYFEVYKDSTIVFDSRDDNPQPLRRASVAVDVDADITDGSTLLLKVIDGGWGRNNQNRAAWGGARLRCGAFDNIRPSVTEVLPVGGETDVSITPTVTIRFSESMDPRFLITAVRLREGSSEIGWSPITNTATTQLTMVLEELNYDTEYTISVNTEARDRVGNRLISAFSSTFTTEAAPATGSIVPLIDLNARSTGAGSVEFRDHPVAIVDPASLDFEKGLGMRTWARVDYNIPVGCSVLQATAGIDVASSDGPICVLKIVGRTTGSTLFSETISDKTITANVNLDITSESAVRLIASSSGTGTAFCNFADAKLVCTDVIRFLSDLPRVSPKGKIVNDSSAGGGRLSFEGTGDEETTSYSYGLVMTPYKKVIYDLPGACSRFLGTFGINPLAGPDVSIQFSIAGSQFTNCNTQILRSGSIQTDMSCNISGASTISVVIKKGGDTVVDDVGTVGLPRLDCQVGITKPKAFIDPLPENFVIGDTINFSGSGLDFQDNPLPAASLHWSVTQHHCAPFCHTHPIFETTGVGSSSFDVDPHGDYFYYEINLRVCDPPVPAGQQPNLLECVFTSKNIYPLAADLTVDSDPANLLVGVDSVNGQGPLQTTVVVGSTVELSTIAEQGNFVFDEWSHNSSPSPTTTVVITDTTARTFVAKFTSV